MVLLLSGFVCFLSLAFHLFACFKFVLGDQVVDSERLGGDSDTSTGASSLRADFLTWHPRIMYVENLLTSSECDFIISYSKNHTRYAPPGPDKSTSLYLPSYPSLPPLLQEIERRIGVITGSPPHPGEESFNIHHISKAHRKVISDPEHDPRDCLSKPGSTADSCNLASDNIHHDKVQKEYSSATAVVYLNDVQVGGGTVFPCVTQYNFEDNKSGAPRLLQVGDHCFEGFFSNGRWFDGDKAVEYGVYQKHHVGNELHHHLTEVLVAAHYGCLEAETPKWIKNKAAKTTARKGSAAVFFHNKVDMTPDELTWHAGCLPLSGDKWTMQKFKELPERYRKPITYGKQVESEEKGGTVEQANNDESNGNNPNKSNNQRRRRRRSASSSKSGSSSDASEL